MAQEPAPPPGDSSPDDLVVGSDGQARCRWAAGSDDYRAYHDHEWGRATDDERALFEKLCLEGFQAGLSWITVLRKRPRFREVFAGFDPTVVAGFGHDDVERLLGDAGIIRHRGKIAATIANAGILNALHADGQSLAGVIWSFEPPRRAAPRSLADVPATTPESQALSKELRRLGFRFVGPTTVYAGMQAMGLVNDHVDGCWVRGACEASRRDLDPPPATR
ncbi:MAG: DNA-3-methyladenine glycosylase I [Acidimicrobiales bacterium]